MPYRPDGSFQTENLPSRTNRRTQPEHGIHAGMVVEFYDTLDPLNKSSRDGTSFGKEVTYDVIITGGEYDGAVFYNVPMAKQFYGTNNYHEITLKSSIHPLLLDEGNEFNFIGVPQRNGDRVLIQFLSGNMSAPIITGILTHPDNPYEEKSIVELGQVKRSSFNGVREEILGDGEYLWAKGFGEFLPYPVITPNVNNLLQPFIHEYVPVPTLEDSITVSASAGALGVSYSIDVSVVPLAVVTTSVSIDGVLDTIELSTAVGSGLSISGLTDTVELSTLVGGGLSISPLEISLTNLIGAGLTINAAGQITLGNPAVELMDLLVQLVQSLATATYSGFGAPGSNVADLTLLLAQFQLLKG